MRRALLVLALLAVPVLGLLLTVDLRSPRRAAPGEVSTISFEGPLRAGAGAAPFALPSTTIPAGYGPMQRNEIPATPGAPLEARALVLAAGPHRFRLVTLDLLEVPPELVAALRTELPEGALWVTATHTHSSLGRYDPSPVAQLIGTGRFDPASLEVVVAAARKALAAAESDLAPATLSFGQQRPPGLSVRRSPGDALEPSDLPPPLFTLRATREGQRPLWLVGAAIHPTLIARPVAQLDGDWPAAVVRELSAQGAFGLVVQGPLGDRGPDRARTPGPTELGHAVVAALPAPERDLPVLPLFWARASAPLPLPTWPAAPGWLRTAVGNLAARWTPERATVEALQLGPVTLLCTPTEPTQMALAALDPSVSRRAWIGLCNGHLGYLDHDDRLAHGTGESRRAAFGIELGGWLTARLRELDHAIEPALKSALPEPEAGR